MGEIAEMILDGTLCEGCGEVFGDFDSPGFPRRCSACRPRAVSPKRKPPVVAGSLSPKLLKRLEEVRLFTDNHSGMYPGLLYELAPAQFGKLIKHGLAATFEPNNPVHKMRVVITRAGRNMLAGII